jgi:heptaprenyl diphosphate synthase
MLQYGWKTAAWVAALRVLAGSLLLGSFLSPGFWLSAAGALSSLLVLATAQHLPRQWFGAVSLSVLAAFGHIAGQLVLAWLWLLPTAALLNLLPVFAAAALLFGALNGFIVARLLAAGASPKGQSSPCTPL